MAYVTGLGIAEVKRYNAHMIGQDGRAVSSRAFVCENDADATVWAKQLVDGYAVELWNGQRCVARLPAKVHQQGAVSHEVIDKH